MADEPFLYPRAGSKGDDHVATWIESLLAELAGHVLSIEDLGPTLVKAYARLYRRLPRAGPGIDKNQVPLLYSLLGSGTSPLKMNTADAAYQLKPVGDQHCGNCSSSYTHNVTNEVICSQVEGKIEAQAWCRLWNMDRC